MHKVLFFMNVIENDTEDVIELKNIISTFIYTFFSPPQVLFMTK